MKPAINKLRIGDAFSDDKNTYYIIGICKKSKKIKLFAVSNTNHRGIHHDPDVWHEYPSVLDDGNYQFVEGTA